MNVATHGTVIFDSVGFAIEDYSILKLIYQLANELDIGKDMYMIPKLDDVKNLYSLLEKEDKDICSSYSFKNEKVSL